MSSAFFKNSVPRKFRRTCLRFEIPLFLGALVLVVVPSPAHAYIDPGAGSLFLQILLGGVAGGLLLLKTYWRRIMGKRKPDDHEDEFPAGKENPTKE